MTPTTTTEAPEGLLVPCNEIVYGRVCGMPARVAKATDPFRCAKHAGDGIEQRARPEGNRSRLLDAVGGARPTTTKEPPVTNDRIRDRYVLDGRNHLVFSAGNGRVWTECGLTDAFDQAVWFRSNAVPVDCPECASLLPEEAK